MSMIDRGVGGMSNDELLVEVARLARRECEATAALIASLAELDARRLYLREGCASLFTYCTERLHLSEHAAYHRIEAARAGRRFPLIVERLERGELTLSAVVLLAPHLTTENHEALLDAARHKSKRLVEQLVARLHPRPDVVSSVRKLPPPRAHATPERSPSPLAATARPATVPLGMELGWSRAESMAASASGPASVVSGAQDRAPKANIREAGAQGEAPLLTEVGTSNGTTMVEAAALVPSRPALVRPLAPSRYQITMTVSEGTQAKLRRAQDLLRHVIPNGDPAAVFDRALTVLIRDLEKTKIAALAKPGGREDGPRRRRHPTRRGPQTRGKAGTGTDRRSAVGMPVADCASPSSPDETPRSRHIPAAVKRAVWARDGGQCAFVGNSGRCSERGFLEFHHRVPWAAGGIATAGNIELRCRSHNLYEAADGIRLDVAQARQARTRSAAATRAAAPTDMKESVHDVRTRPGAS